MKILYCSREILKGEEQQSGPGLGLPEVTLWHHQPAQAGPNLG